MNNRCDRRVFLATLFAAVPGLALGQSSAERTIASASELEAALAAGVTTILLSPGSYREISLTQKRPAALVTLKAADPARPPLVHKLIISDAANFAISGWRMTPHPDDGTRGVLVDVQRSKNITLSGVTLSVDAALPDHRWRGVAATDVDDFTMRRCTVTGVERGLLMLRNQKASIAHNLFSQLGAAAINIVESDAVTIESNRIHGLKAGPGVSGTFVHGWTRGAQRPIRNLVIRNNVMTQDTPSPAQGIFLSNEARIPYENVSINGNVVVVGTPHAITVDRAVNVNVTDNIALDTVESAFNAAVRLTRVRTGEASNNLAPSFAMSENIDVLLRRNATIARLERRTRELFLKRLELGLRGSGEGLIHAQHRVTNAQRAAGPGI